MKCPHCLEGFHSAPGEVNLSKDSEYTWKVTEEICPECNKIIIHLQAGNYQSPQFFYVKKEFLVYPKSISRTPLSPIIPEKFAGDYNEACLVLEDSPKASAALSRRCLQLILREKGGAEKSDLFHEIQEMLDSKQLPSYLEDNIDEIRKIGKFAAHPNKSKSTGEIVEVEPHEAEWNLNVLEGLFDFYFVQADENKKKRDLLKKKLDDAKTPPQNNQRS